MDRYALEGSPAVARISFQFVIAIKREFPREAGDEDEATTDSVVGAPWSASRGRVDWGGDGAQRPADRLLTVRDSPTALALGTRAASVVRLPTTFREQRLSEAPSCPAHAVLHRFGGQLQRPSGVGLRKLVECGENQGLPELQR